MSKCQQILYEGRDYGAASSCTSSAKHNPSKPCPPDLLSTTIHQRRRRIVCPVLTQRPATDKSSSGQGGGHQRFYTQDVEGKEDDSIEKFFSTFVEGDYAAVAKRMADLKGDFVLRPPEIPVLLRFVVTQIVRTQAHLECIKKQAGTDISRGVFIHNMYRKMKLIASRWQRQAPEIILWTPLPFMATQFITGDNPVLCFCRTEEEPRVQRLVPPEPRIIDLSVSLESSHNGFIVPLSPYLALTIVNSGTRDFVRLRPAQCTDPRIVRDFNRMIYNQCVNFVAAKDPDHLKFHIKK